MELSTKLKVGRVNSHARLMAFLSLTTPQDARVYIQSIGTIRTSKSACWWLAITWTVLGRKMKPFIHMNRAVVTCVIVHCGNTWTLTWTACAKMVSNFFIVNILRKISTFFKVFVASMASAFHVDATILNTTQNSNISQMIYNFFWKLLKKCQFSWIFNFIDETFDVKGKKLIF